MKIISASVYLATNLEIYFRLGLHPLVIFRQAKETSQGEIYRTLNVIDISIISNGHGLERLMKVTYEDGTWENFYNIPFSTKSGKENEN